MAETYGADVYGVGDYGHGLAHDGYGSGLYGAGGYGGSAGGGGGNPFPAFQQRRKPVTKHTAVLNDDDEAAIALVLALL